jgi:hypothetical protein
MHLLWFFSSRIYYSSFLSLLISLIEPVMEPQCEKIEHQLSNDGSSSWGHVSAATSIYHQVQP